MLRLITLILFSMVGVHALANSGAEHEPAGIPWESIQKQVINFLLMMALLTYILKSKIGVFFKSRAENFEKLLVQARLAREAAEKQKTEMKSRLEKLESSANDSVEKARSEAEELKQRIRAEAEALAAQIRADAKTSAQREIERAKMELKEEVLNQTMAASRNLLRTAVKDQDQKRLQNEFVDKIQVVR